MTLNVIMLITEQLTKPVVENVLEQVPAIKQVILYSDTPDEQFIPWQQLETSPITEIITSTCYRRSTNHLYFWYNR